MGSIGTDQSSLGIGFSFPILGGAFVALRFYQRSRLKVPRGWDDWLCIPAWICVTGCSASLLAIALKDLNTSDSDSDSAASQQFSAQLTGALVAFWIYASAFIKLSILFFYQRVFRGRIFSFFNKLLIYATLAWTVYATIAWLLYCGTDVKANFEGPWASCEGWGFKIQIPTFTLDTVIDAGLLVLPVPSIWKLKLDFSKKFFITIIFMIGGFAFVAGLCNTIIQFFLLTQPDFTDSADGDGFFQGSSISIYNWPTVEVGVGLITCNLPSLSNRSASSLPKHIKRAWDSLRGTSSSATWSLKSKDESKDVSGKEGVRGGYGGRETREREMRSEMRRGFGNNVRVESAEFGGYGGGGNGGGNGSGGRSGNGRGWYGYGGRSEERREFSGLGSADEEERLGLPIYGTEFVGRGNENRRAEFE